MNSRERIHQIIKGEEPDRCGFWLGNPDIESWQRYYPFFGTKSEEAIRRKLGDDIRWIGPQFILSTYQNLQNRDMFYASMRKSSHSQKGPFADCEDVREVDAFKWPDARELHFGETLDNLKKSGDMYRLSGFWIPFYHNCMDLFGMEDYMVKMHTHPEIVHAVTDRVCTYYYEANERFLSEAGDLVDGYFFGNDFGTQSNLICGPDQFNTFIMPWFRRFTQQGHDHGHQVILHSCGSIYSVIDDLIDAGVDCLHPLQARAAHMDAETLAAEFKGQIAFMGGVDTQELLVHGSPDDVGRDVERVKGLLGPNLIVSPSHEALLPNVSPENVQAMAQAATR